jgi:hypothetical protein
LAVRKGNGMLLQERLTHVGDIRCLNCGRSLAEVIRDGETGKMSLRPAANQSKVQVVVAGRRMLRCARCHGRAFAEQLMEPGEEHFASPPAMQGVA